jgi:hypothetical protein
MTVIKLQIHHAVVNLYGSKIAFLITQSITSQL